MQHHARVIQNALWNLDPESPVEYLTLAAISDNFGEIGITDIYGGTFLRIKGPELSLVDRFFKSIGLLAVEPHRVPVMRKDQVIGHMNMTHNHNSIYFHLYVLSSLLLLLTAYIFYLRTLNAKRYLESRVSERTKELAQAMSKAQESEEKFRAFSEQTVLGIMAYQKDRFIYSNKAAADIFSVEINQILNWRGEEYLKHMPDDDDTELLAHQIAGNLGISTWRTKSQNKSGRWVESISRQVRFHGKEAILLSLHDITEKKVMEEELHQRDKMNSVGELAGGIAHDFNNMLGGIIGAAEIIENRQDITDSQKPLIGMILKAARRAADLTNKLLAFSRKGIMVTHDFSVHSLIDDVIALLSHTLDKRINIVSELTAGQHVISGDPSQVQNAILNLAVNARDAITHGGDITLSTKEIELNKAYCNSSPFEIRPGDFIQLSIQDNGLGIPSHLQQKIFEPFFTTKGVGKGTGLGLSAVYGTIKDHHGAVTVYSEEGVGTVFHIYLPLSRGEDHEVLHTQTAKIPRGSGTVLVIDDEEVIRNTAKIILKNLGYEVMSANDGEEGVEVFKEHQSKIDLVLMDMVMPKMSGTECFHAIREISHDIPILLCSGFTGSASINELLENGATAFLKKPYTTPDISQAIYLALH